jgi:hypothetical protein
MKKECPCGCTIGDGLEADENWNFCPWCGDELTEIDEE